MQCNPKPQPGTWRYARVTPAPTPKPPMTKEEFLVQYVLNRALTASSGLSGDGAAEAGIRAWDTIQKACTK